MHKNSIYIPFSALSPLQKAPKSNMHSLIFPCFSSPATLTLKAARLWWACWWLSLAYISVDPNVGLILVVQFNASSEIRDTPPGVVEAKDSAETFMSRKTPPRSMTTQRKKRVIFLSERCPTFDLRLAMDVKRSGGETMVVAKPFYQAFGYYWWFFTWNVSTWIYPVALFTVKLPTSYQNMM